MDLNRVRFAGYLSKVEYKQTTNYWCVIRDGGFFVYNYHNVTSAPSGYRLEDTPVQQLLISHLSATAYVLPNGNKRAPTTFALQLDCADTGVATTFFAEHEWALEQWVDAIKAEASADHVFPSEECDLLPPRGYHGLRRESLEVATAGAIEERKSPANYEHEVIVEQAESVFDRLVKDVVAPSKEYGLAAAKAARSPLLSEKSLKKTFMLRALPDVIPLEQQRQQFKDQSLKSPLASRRRHLTPSPASSSTASSSRIGSSCQGSADESSLGSAAQFSPTVTRRRNNPRAPPERETLRPSHRQPAPAPALTRSPSKPRSQRKDQTWSRNEPQGGNGLVAGGSKSKPTAFVLAQEAARKGGFRDAAEADRANTGLEAGQHSRKRHTITVVQHSTGRNDGKPKDVRKGVSPEQSPKTRARHSIAPLSSLDLNIAQRRRATRQLPEARLFYSENRGHLTSYESSTSSSSSSSEDEDEDEANKSHAADYNRPSVEITSSPNTSRASGWSTTTSTSFDSSFNEGDFSASFSSTNEDMRSALHKLKGRLQVPSPDHSQAEEPSSTSSIEGPHPAPEPIRKASESFGNRFLHRAKSMIGKQHKSEDRPSAKSLAASPNVRANSLSEDCMDLAKSRAGDEVEGTRTNEPKEDCQADRRADLGPIHLEGTLFRRKRLKWSRVWAVLHTSKMMAFYKEESHRERGVPLFLIDLRLGCDIENVTQDKSGSSFTLTSNSNPKDDGKNRSLVGQIEKGAESRTRRSAQLLCKSVHEFVYWIKAFVMVNTSGELPAKESSSPPPVNDSLISKQGQSGINFEFSSRFDVPGIAYPSAAAGSTYAPGVDVLEDFPTLRCVVTPPPLSGLDPWAPDAIITSQTPLFKLDRNANHPRDNKMDVTVADAVLDSSTVSNDSRMETSGKTLESAGGVKRSFGAETSREKVIARDLLADAPGSHDNGRREQTDSSSNIRGASQPGPRSTSEGQYQVRGIKAANLQVGESGACQVDAGEVRSDRAPNRRCNNDAPSPGPRALIGGESDCGAAQTGATRGRSSADERELPPALPSSSRALVQKATDCSDSITSGRIAVPAAAAAALESPRIIAQDTVNNKLIVNGALDQHLLDNISSLEKHFYPDVFESAVTASLPYLNDDQLICKAKSSFRRRRRHSDGNILEACCDKPYRMRFSRRPVPELTKIDFIEIYGGYNANKDACTDSDVHTHLNINMKFLTQKRRSVHKASEDRLSLSEESTSSCVSSSGIGSTDKPNTSNLERSHSHLSSASASSDGSTKVGTRSGRFSHIAAALRLGSRGGDQTGTSSASKATVLHLPASQMTNAAHRGYMDRRGKKKQWERFWCVLQDSCLYCYNSPQSASTRDVILLRGYDVIADVINVNRSRFMFRLAQEGAPTLHFSADNHQDYLLWVGTLERDTRSVNNPGSGASPDGNRKDNNNSSKCTNSLSPAHSVSGGSLRSSDSAEDASRSNISSSLHHSESSERLGQDLVEMEKHKLLKEIVNQQHQILHEQKQLAKKISSDSPSSSPTASAASPLVPRRSGNSIVASPPAPAAIRREVVLDRYERVRDAEDLKMAKFMTHLTRRRNSAQLKVDQLSREIAPRAGKRRSADHRRFAAVEARLGEMRARLAGIDEEIAVGQAKQQNVISKLRERQDFELLLAEQQETLAIMRRHEHDVSTGLVVPPARRFHRASSASAVTTGRREPLASIEDLSSISDCSSSGSLELSSESKGVIRTMSTPRQQRSERRDCAVIPLSSDSIDATEEYNRRVIRPSVLCSRSSSSIEDPIASSSMSCSASSLPADPSQSAEVDPAVMAEIEMFEQFSALTLQKIQSRSPQNSL